MTLPSSGAISASDVNTELGRTSNAQFNIGGSEERRLMGMQGKGNAGNLTMSDFYGQSDDVTLVDVVSSSFGSNHVINNVNFGHAFTGRRLILVFFTVGRTQGVDPTLTSMHVTNIDVAGTTFTDVETVWKSGVVVFTDEFCGVAFRSGVKDADTSGTVEFDTSFDTVVHMAVFSTKLSSTVNTTTSNVNSSSASGSVTKYADGATVQFIAKVLDEAITFTNGTKLYEDRTITVGNSDYTIALSLDAEQTAGALTVGFSTSSASNHAYGGVAVDN